MSFSEQTGKLVNDLINAEYNGACKFYGDKYNSLHEGYAVLLEEVEEMERNVTEIKQDMRLLWRDVKNNEYPQDRIAIIGQETIQAIEELAQVGAVLMKIKNTLEVEK